MKRIILRACTIFPFAGVGLFGQKSVRLGFALSPYTASSVRPFLFVNSGLLKNRLYNFEMETWGSQT